MTFRSDYLRVPGESRLRYGGKRSRLASPIDWSPGRRGYTPTCSGPTHPCGRWCSNRGRNWRHPAGGLPNVPHERAV